MSTETQTQMVGFLILNRSSLAFLNFECYTYLILNTICHYYIVCEEDGRLY
uniref:Uncharacterized protein n=1 Tax=Anguilla anguilla TaxID=7936 RepID=A0A0E9XLL3_ANGAN